MAEGSAPRANLMDLVRLSKRMTPPDGTSRNGWSVYAFSASAKDGAWLYIRHLTGVTHKARSEDLEVVS